MTTTLSDIRSTFIDFFKKNNHEQVTSSPLVPHNDPTLLFTNAGMVQFKDVFTGLEKRPYTRAVSSQKCLRAGGKHNDLENVGYTARHHTFFEMLGNFSFGDYFKEQAIEFAWTLITKEFNLSPQRLLVTVYSEDEEAAALWKKIAGLSSDRIISIPTSDNFWSMGDTGPCGPCTEIFYDHGEEIPGGPPGSATEDGDRFIEIWNLVFMQFDQMANGKRMLLPKPCVDTGMGIERLTSVLQGRHNNFHTDLFQVLRHYSIDLTKRAEPVHEQSHNVIADHLRACSFLLADGVLPSNEGRGYVLRRIMRRAMRHAHILGAKEPLMHQLVPRLVELMGAAYPELGRAQALIQDNLLREEEKFRQTLERGLRLLKEETAKLSPSQPLPGAVAFKLYDTYGFPLDLTQDVVRSENRLVEQTGFDEAMLTQKESARAAWAGSGDAKNDHIWYDYYATLGATDFLGYTTTTAEALVTALLDENGTSLEEAPKGSLVQILVNQTPFYGESGGQMGDAGTLEAPGLKVEISDTLKKVNGLFVHKGKVLEGRVKVGQAAKLEVHEERRRQLQANHSATHLLHAALRSLLGNHITQKGSLVAPDRLRFDFTHNQALTRDQIRAIEQVVNQQITLNKPVVTHVMSQEEALKKGAMALFGERYGTDVRVLSMGQKKEEIGYAAFSLELCGGTHVERTGDIGLCKIISEGGVSAGVRRIEAVTGQKALEHLQKLELTLETIAASLKTNLADAAQKVDTVLADRKALERQLNDVKKQLSSGSSSASHFPIRSVGNYQFIHHHGENMDMKDLKPLADTLKAQIKSGVVVISAVKEDKMSFLVGVTTNLSQYLSAVDLIQRVVPLIGGKGGGGRPDLAQAGGTDKTQITQAVQMIELALKEVP